MSADSSISRVRFQSTPRNITGHKTEDSRTTSAMQEASARMYQATQFTNLKSEGNNLLSKRTARLKNHLCRLMKSGATPPSPLLAMLLLLLPLLLTLQKLVAFDALGVSGCSPLFFLTLHLRASFYFAAQNLVLYFIVLFPPAL